MADQPDNKQFGPPDTPNDEQQPKTPSAEGWQPPEGESAALPDKLAGWREPPVERGSSRPVVVESWFKPDDALEERSETGADADAPPATRPDELPSTFPEQTGGWFTPLDAQLDALLSGAAETIVEIHEAKPLPPQARRVGEKAEPEAAAGAEIRPTTDTQPTAAAETAAQPAVEDEAQVGVAGLLTPAAEAEIETEAPVVEVAETPSTPREAVSASETDGGRDTADLLSMEELAATTVLPAESPPADTGPVIEEPIPVAEATPLTVSTPPQPSRGLSPAEAAFLAEQRAARAEAQILPDSQPVAAAEPAPTPAPAPVEPSQPVQPEQPTPPPEPSPFDQVERKVGVLRQRYQAGYLTREELQNELRNLMILDDDGRWWMLGLESNRWYFYDGQTWTPDEPPRTKQPTPESAVPTETGMQEVVVEATVQPGLRPKIEIDEDGMPLPARVPQEDPGATLVSPSTPYMEPVRRSEAPTHPKVGQVEPEAEEAFIASPGVDEQLTQPSRPEPAYAGEQQTIRSDAVHAERVATQERAAIPVPPQARGGEAVTEPKPKLGEFSQPDYSAALGSSRNRNTYVKWTIRFSIFAIIGGMVMTLLVLLAMIGYYFYVIGEYKDAVGSLTTRAASFETTKIFDAEGNLLAEFSDPNQGRRNSVALAEISPWLIHATVSTENETFYTDPGFSVVAIVRAAYQNVRSGDIRSGASTITQQLARALVLETDYASERTAKRKIDEIIVASEIKRQYSKNEILEIYLNEIFYGNMASGVEAAARTYFGKSASELNPAEAAFLAGIPQSPATYDPVVNREAALARMKTVLRLMSEANGTGCISIQHDDLTSWGVADGGALCITTQTDPDGNVLYFYQTPNMPAPQEMTAEIAMVEIRTYRPPRFQAEHPHFVNYVWQQLENEYGSQAIYSAGYRVYTTLDPKLQSAAEEIVSANLADLQARGLNATNASVVAIRPADGAVLTMVGSADYYNDDIDGQVNVAFTGQQPGSSIKPFVYLTAFEPDVNGNYWTPATVIWDVETDFNGYKPTNYDFRYHGPQTVRSSLANSYNVPAVKALNYVGLDRFTEMAQRVGLTFPLGDPIERQAGLPTALGAVEVRLFDMTAAFAMLANNGRYVEPYSIIRIEDSDENEIYLAETNPEGWQVVNPQYAYLITSILADNEARLDAFGSVQWYMRLDDGRNAAIKTGTTTDNRDVWTMGYTPQLAVGVWVGNSDNSEIGNITGSTGAAPIWKQVMQVAHADLPVQNFTPPPGISDPVEVCLDSGTRPSAACAGNTYWEIFAENAPPPPAEQDVFRTLQVDAFTGKLVNEYCADMPEIRTFIVIDDPAAYNWINTTYDGNLWAQNRGIKLPAQPPPTEYCDPNEARPYVQFTYPVENGTVQDVIQLRGIINMPNLNRYEVRYGISHNPPAFSEPLFTDVPQQTDVETILGQFDTRSLTNGPYTLRLTVYDNQGRSVTRDMHINVNNQALPTPAPTLTPVPTQPPIEDVQPPVITPTPG